VSELSLEDLTDFVVQAKAATYIGEGPRSLSYRLASCDLQYHSGPFSYLDSYFGGSDFIGQEVVYYDSKPVWAMNYYGRILDPDQMDQAQAGEILRKALSALYEEGRFLGGYQYSAGDITYIDLNDGDISQFSGREWMLRGETKVYELQYHGGLVKD
jgi:hypothetical protein